MACKTIPVGSALSLTLNLKEPPCAGAGASDLTGATSVRLELTDPTGAPVTSPDLSAVAIADAATGLVVTPVITWGVVGAWILKGFTVGETGGVIRSTFKTTIVVAE